MAAFAYLRRSSVDDPTGQVPFEVEERTVRELAAHHGDGGVLVFLADRDTPGRRGIAARPGYRALLEAIEAGQATTLYSYSFSRLARSLPELSRLVAQCTLKEIPIRLVADCIDTSTTSGRLVTQVLDSVAKFEADVASERRRAARVAKLARGEPIGSAHRDSEYVWEEARAFVLAFQQAVSLERRAIPERAGHQCAAAAKHVCD